MKICGNDRKTLTVNFPKGKVDHGELVQNSAIREVQEETGLKNVHIVSHHISTFHLYQNLPYSSDFIFKETKWFFMEASSQALLVPQIEEGITDLKWVSMNEFNVLNCYASIRDLV